MLNDHGRFTDCSELVTTLPELVELAWLDGKSIHDLTPDATFYASVQEGWTLPVTAPAPTEEFAEAAAE